jgi:hypothetical protein
VSRVAVRDGVLFIVVRCIRQFHHVSGISATVVYFFTFLCSILVDSSSINVRTQGIRFRSPRVSKDCRIMRRIHGSDAYSEFRDSFDGDIAVDRATVVRLVNHQADVLNENIFDSQIRTDFDRRQCAVILLELCVMMCSGMFNSSDRVSRRRFRRIRRAVERALRLSRGG